MRAMTYPDTPYPESDDGDEIHPVLDALLKKAALRRRSEMTPEEEELYNREALERLARAKAADDAWLASLSSEERAAELQRRDDRFQEAVRKVDEDQVLHPLEDEFYQHLEENGALDLATEMVTRPPFRP